MQTTVNKLLNSIAIDNNVVQNALGNDNEVIQCACVRGGHLKWKYKDWVQHSKPGVRKLIAEKYPEYIPLLPFETDWELNEVKNYLLERFKPKLDILEKFLAKVDPTQNHNTEIIALQLKHETLTRGMTTIEKTMTPKQLFTTGHPLWEKPYTINEIEFILKNMNNCTCYEELEDMIRSYSEMIKYLHNQTDFDSLYPDSITNLMKGT